MQRFGLFFLYCLALVSMTASAATYTLVDGTKISGDPISENDSGVEFKTGPDTVLPRVSWDQLTQDSIRTLLSEAKTPHERALLEPLIDELPQEKAKRKEIIVKPIDPPVRPTQHLGAFAILGSPLGWMILLALYGANIFASFEVARYRHQPPATVCGLGAIPVFGVLSPIIFLALPPRVPVTDPAAHAKAEESAAPIHLKNHPQYSSTPASEVSTDSPVSLEPTAPPAATPARTLPEPIVFSRGEFSFNRRFFETKFPGFFRVVPSEADRDLVLFIKSGRGDFVGRRITRITPAELYLQIYNNNATADEMIPFIEVLEVQVRHKDSI